MAVRVSAEDFDTKVLQSKLPVIVEFYSDSCIPCKQLSPILGGMASPTIIFFKGGEEVSRIRGLVKRNALEEEVGKLL